MNKQSKFNIVDILILLLILLVAGGGYYFFNQSNAKGKTKIVKFTVEIKETSQEYADTIQQHMEVRDAVRDTFYGYVDQVETKPTLFINENKIDGTFVISTLPDEFNTYVTVICDGLVTPTEITVNGETLNVGKSAYIKGKGFAGEGFITDLVVE